MRFLLSFFFISLLGFKAQAYSINPSTIEIDSKSSNSSAVIQVTNTSNEELTVQSFMKVKEIKSDGTEVTTPLSEKDFLIFPAKLAIKPKTMGSMRLMYVGKKDFKAEKSYRLLITQLPPSAKKKTKGSSLGILFAYNVNVYVAPKGAASQLQTEFKLDGENKPSSIMIRNIGTKHKKLKRAKLIVKSEGKAVDVDVKKRFDKPILAGGIREIPLPATLNASKSAEIIIQED